MDVVTLSRLLGHANPSITLDKYGHALDDHKKASIGKLGDLYAGTRKMPPANTRSGAAKTGGNADRVKLPNGLSAFIQKIPGPGRWCSPPGRLHADDPLLYRSPSRCTVHPPGQKPGSICPQGPRSSIPELRPAGRG